MLIFHIGQRYIILTACFYVLITSGFCDFKVFNSHAYFVIKRILAFSMLGFARLEGMERATILACFSTNVLFLNTGFSIVTSSCSIA